MEADGDEASFACSWAVVCIAYFAVAVHNTVALTANLTVAIAVWKYVGITNGEAEGVDEMSSLKMEMLVNDLATS